MTIYLTLTCNRVFTSDKDTSGTQTLLIVFYCSAGGGEEPVERRGEDGNDVTGRRTKESVLSAAATIVGHRSHGSAA